MRRSIVCSFAAIGLMILAAAATASAHHSFDAEYDSTKTANFTGIVTKVDWQNPHAYIFVNCTDEKGQVKNLRFELGPPYALIRGGWTKETVKIGDKISVENGALAKDPANPWVGALNQTQLVLASGTKLTMR